MRKNILSAVVISTLLAAAPAEAAIVQFTDRAAFNAAAGGVTVEVFNTSSRVNLAPETDLGAFTVSSNSHAILANCCFGLILDGTPHLEVSLISPDPDGVAPGTITFTFDTPIFAFGADFRVLNDNPFTPDTAGFPHTFATVGGTVFDPLPVAPPFLGWVSTTAFTTVTFLTDGLSLDGTPLNGFFIVDNLAFGGAAPPVPEPATWAMMIGGFGLTGAMMRRRRISVT